MPDLRDLKMMVQSLTPLIAVETHEERRVIDMLRLIALERQQPFFRWSVTDGLQRAETGVLPHKTASSPEDVLKHIRGIKTPAFFALLDFHPYLENPLHIRLIRELAQGYVNTPHHLFFLSPEIDMPRELAPYSAKFRLTIPDEAKLLQIITAVAQEWCRSNPGRRVVADKKAVQLLARNLLGLTTGDAERLARQAIYDDGAITKSDMKGVMQAKYNMISQTGVLSFEYETAAFAEVGGLSKIKEWVALRRAVFQGTAHSYGLDPPKGILLLGVQGCGKSLAAKAVAGVLGVPLLRFDFAALYDKYLGETERNLRESLQAAETMSPCVLWVDEIEKGLASGSGDDGVSRRVLGTLLTWMAEKKKPVFIVATSNDVSALPPELLRKGRFDEIFFVDLPDAETRALIFKIQMTKRKLDSAPFDLNALSATADGFSGSEIEQAIVSALYVAMAANRMVTQQDIEAEILKTRPLSVMMSEKISQLREWALSRTVPAH
ncbi:MAG: AAA family ATPase [Acidobacteria bacterium]|nr:AAA family ATPase [Acidobacteriota bacterium]